MNPSRLDPVPRLSLQPHQDQWPHGGGLDAGNGVRNQHNQLMESPISKAAPGKDRHPDGRHWIGKERGWLGLFLLTRKAHLEREEFVFWKLKTFNILSPGVQVSPYSLASRV